MDTSCEYSIVLTSDRVDTLKHTLEAFKAKTKQEAIYLEVLRHVDLLLI